MGSCPTISSGMMLSAEAPAAAASDQLAFDFDDPAQGQDSMIRARAVIDLARALENELDERGEGSLLADVELPLLRTLAVMGVVLVAVVLLAVGLFKLTVFGALALYFVVWWTLLFVILPLRNQVETDPERIVPGQDPGAPAAPRGPTGTSERRLSEGW